MRHLFTSFHCVGLSFPVGGVGTNLGKLFAKTHTGIYGKDRNCSDDNEIVSLYWNRYLCVKIQPGFSFRFLLTYLLF